MLSTWMNGKRSPTAKFESQLTVPAIMNAAGLCDCWKNSPVRTNGIPPETKSNNSVILGNFLCQELFLLQRRTCPALHTSATSTALQTSAQVHTGASEPVTCDLSKLCFREVTLYTTTSPGLHTFSDGKQATEQWIHTTASRAPCDEPFIKNKSACFY